MKTSELFANCEPIVRELYEALMNRIQAFGPIAVETKKSSIHVLYRAAFLGVHPKKGFLELNVVSEKPLKNRKVVKTEQVSKNRFHNRVRLARKDDMDQELTGLLRNAYDLLSQNAKQEDAG